MRISKKVRILLFIVISISIIPISIIDIKDIMYNIDNQLLINAPQFLTISVWIIAQFVKKLAMILAYSILLYLISNDFNYGKAFFIIYLILTVLIVLIVSISHREELATHFISRPYLFFIFLGAYHLKKREF